MPTYPPMVDPKSEKPLGQCEDEDATPEAHIALQELQAVTMMLHRMAFCLSGKVVSLHLDNSTAKAHLCNQGGMISPFVSRLACWILSLIDKHSMILIPAYILPI